MSIDLSSPDAVATLPETDRFATGPLLIATDGSTSSEAAFPAAMLLASHLETEVEVLSVIEPIPLMGGYPSAPTTYLGDVVDTEPALQRATEQVRKLGEGATRWPVNVILGNPVDVIVREARERRARMIVVGLNHHDTLDRLLWGDTMLGLVRRGDTPVLAVSPALKSLPRRVVIAVDFSQASVAAMRAALMLLDTPATVYLVHVKVTAELPLTEFALWDREYDVALPEAFDRVTAELDIPPGVRVERVILRGHTPRAILEFAESIDADLLVAGSHGHGAIRRLIVGSVVTHLLRRTPCSILIVPRPDAEYLGLEPRGQHVEGFMPSEIPDWSCRGISPATAL